LTFLGQGLPLIQSQSGSLAQVAYLLLLGDNAKQLNLEAVNAERLKLSKKLGKLKPIRHLPIALEFKEVGSHITHYSSLENQATHHLGASKLG
jgi:hypothetical protein